MGKTRGALSLAMACFLALGTMAGCGKSQTSMRQSASIPKDVKLTWYGNNYASAVVSDMGDVKCIQEIEKDTGIQITFQQPAAGSNGAEQLNLMLASNQLPDIINWAWTDIPGGIAKYLSNGTFIKLNDLVKKDAPNYQAALNKYPECRKAAILDDGTLPAFYGLYTDSLCTAYVGLTLRGDWLDKLGLKAPATIDEWHTVLTAFKTQDPNGNGKADEIPYSQPSGNAYANFAGAFGILDGMYIDPSSGKVKYGPIEAGYKSFITTMAQWYKEKLIDPDFATNDGNAFNSKLQGNIAGSSVLSLGGGIGNSTTAARVKTPDFRLEGVATPQASNGKAYATTNNLIQKTANGSVITKACKYPDAAAKFLDYAYSAKGDALMNFGIEGESYTVQNGKRVFTDEILKNSQGKSPSVAASVYCFPIIGISKLMEYDPYSAIQMALPEQKRSNNAWSNLDSSMLLPYNLQFTSDESSRLSSIMNDVNTYQKEEELKFILGAEPLSNLDGSVSKIKSMNVADAIKIYQQAVDRYNTRK